MREKEKLFIAKLIEKQAILTQILYKNMRIIGEDILEELDEAVMFDDILDYIGVPSDNTTELGCSHQDVFCRDSYYDILYSESMLMPEALKWLNNELVFLAQLIECGGIAQWREKYEKKE